MEHKGKLSSKSKRTIERCNTETDSESALVKCRSTKQRKNAELRIEKNEKAGTVFESNGCFSCVHHFYQQFRNDQVVNANFLKNVKWSPDGSSFLTLSNDSRFWRFTLPEPNGKKGIGSCSGLSDGDSFPADLVLTEGSFVYDYCWYPHMSASDPDTCIFANCSMEQPIHLWDATTGRVRASYVPLRGFDELITCYSMTFNLAGNRIYAGCSKTIAAFDLHRPGKQSACYPIFQKNEYSKSGIATAFAFSPSNPQILAVASYNGKVAICTEIDMSVIQTIKCHEVGGITKVQFSKDGRYMYTAAQRESEILCWDVRYSYKVVSKFYRHGSNVCRLCFDIDPSDRHLGAGSEDGTVYIYDTQTGDRVSKFQAASDAVNGFSFHPWRPLAATSSGQSRYGIYADEQYSFGVYENCVSVWDLSKGTTFQPCN